MFKLTPRLRRLAVYLGVLVVAGGLALATLGPHPAHAEIANPKQRFIDQMNADLAHAKSLASQSAPITGGKPSVAPVDLSQYGDGFVETPNYPCPSAFCLIRNMYSTVRNGRLVQVFGGSERPDTAQGIILIRTIDLNAHGDPTELTVRMPGRAGPVHLDTAAGDVVTFTTDQGAHGSFNFVTHRFAQ